MKTHTKILAAVGALACAAITVAQFVDGQARASAGGGQSGGGVAVASEGNGNLRAAPLSTMQGVLSRHLVNIQNYLIEKYNDPKVTEQVILAHCSSQLKLRTRDQQLKEIYDVWDIDTWKPGPQWEAMTKVQTVIDKLLNIDPKSAKEIQELENKISDEFMQPLRDFIERENLASLPKAEANQRIYEWSQQQYKGVTMVERSRRAVERSQRVIDFARTRLTKDQVAEMDLLLNMFKQKTDAIEAAAVRDR